VEKVNVDVFGDRGWVSAAMRKPCKTVTVMTGRLRHCNGKGSVRELLTLWRAWTVAVPTLWYWLERTDAAVGRANTRLKV